MLKLPVRKCFYVAKVALILLLVLGILASIERWRGGKRTASAQDLDPAESFEAQVIADEARIIPGLGEGGAPAFLYGKQKELGIESEKKLAINVYLSDRISYNRSLDDHRNPACKRVVYDAELPSASVIIIFHNEPYSVVVRTLWSVINSVRRDQPWYQKANFIDRESGRTMTLGYAGQDPDSKFVYLKEVILVDDNSTLPELKGKLSHYIRTRLPPDLIRILRLPERAGLTLARLRGARSARGEVLVFLDAHCETEADWLRPLLQRTRHKRDAVLTPVIDVVDENNFSLIGNDDIQTDDKTDRLPITLKKCPRQKPSQRDEWEVIYVGGFTFMGHFTWIDVPEREKKRRGSDIGATWSPTMAGGLFAINREYYWDLGAYDEQMAGWGGENLEMSFRIWQCGGTLETIPCSRVGHVFRAFHPYGLPAKSDTHGINTARMAEVWMDDYKELFYLHRPDLRKNPKIGDVTHRKVLREKLQCKSFEWYLQHVYKEKFVPVRDAFGYGRFRNIASGLCLDTLQREGDTVPLGVYPCHPTLQGTQHLSLALDGQLRDEERCVQLQFTRDNSNERLGRKLLMVDCNKTPHGQKWRYTSTKQLIHVATHLCLDSGFEPGADARATPCRPAAPTQRWEIDYSEQNGFRLDGDRDMTEAEQTLQKLRGQRRISRSLLSFAEGENATTKVRRHSHKKRRHKKRSRKHGKIKRSRPRTKNKFILKLVRTLMNNTEDHLEVEIHCKHKKLYPNNSFVRDLVTILNEKNIKVINNGRVFERNRVVELVHGQKEPKEAKVLEKLEVEARVGMDGLDALSMPALLEPPPETVTAPRLPGPKIKMDPLNQHRSRLGRKRRPKITRPALSRPKNGVNEEGPDPSNQKKIIIEDFVEVKTSPSPDPVKANRGDRIIRKKKKRLPPGDPEAGASVAKQVERYYKGREMNAPMSMSTPPEDVEPPQNNAMEQSPDSREALKKHPQQSPDSGEALKNYPQQSLDSRETPKKVPQKRADSRELPKKYSRQSLDSREVLKKYLQESLDSREALKKYPPESLDSREALKKYHQESPNSSEALKKNLREPSDSREVPKSFPRHSPDSQEAPKKVTQQSRDSREGADGRRSLKKSDKMLTAKDVDSKEDSRDVWDRFEVDGNFVNQSRQAMRRQRTPKNALDIETPSTTPESVDDSFKPGLNKTQRSGSGGSGHDASPVKVVMKSNLTFNLGKDFFKWRSSKAMHDLLGELAIPANSTGTKRASPPMHEWVKPAPKVVARTRARSLDTLTIDAEAVSSVRSASSQMHSAADGDETSSSSSESAGER